MKIHHSRKFDTVQELMNFCSEDKNNVPYKKRSSDSCHVPDHDWDLNTGIKGARELIESGWEQGTKDVISFNGEIMGKSDYVELPSFEPAELGEMVEPGEYFAGNPECFYTQEIVEQKKPVVKIGLHVSISWTYTSQDLINRGGAMLSLIEMIENQRINTELWGIILSTTKRKRLCYEVCIKKSSEPFDIDKLAFILAHPAMFRRIGFSLMECDTSEVRELHNVPGYYGRYSETLESNEYDLIPEYSPNSFKTKEKARTWIKECAVNAGIEIE